MHPAWLVCADGASRRRRQGLPAPGFGTWLPASNAASISRRARDQRSLSPAAARASDPAVFSLFQVCVESLAAGMAVLCLLDFVRVWLGQDLHVLLLRPCKGDSALTCAPHTGLC